MNIKELLVILALSLPAAAMAAGSLDLNVRDDSIQARYSTVVGEQALGNLEADFGVLFNDDSKRVLGAGLHVADYAGGEELPVYAGVGGRLLWVDGDVDSGVVLALGGFGRVTLPGADRISLGANAHFAPGITAFGGARRYLELGARGEYHLLERAWLYLGYRRVRAGFDRVTTRTIDSGLHVGMRFEL